MTDNESSDSDYTLLQIVLKAQPTWAAICCVPPMCQVCHIWIRLGLYWKKLDSYTGNCHEAREMHTTLPASSTHPIVLSSAFQFCTLSLVIPCQFLLSLVWLSTSMWSCTLKTRASALERSSPCWGKQAISGNQDLTQVSQLPATNPPSRRSIGIRNYSS